MRNFRSGSSRIACSLVAALVLGVGVGAGVGEGTAEAQTAGALIGQVFDASGTPLAGVRITIESSTQIGGSKTVISDADGRFRFLGLIPGKFKLTASAPKLQRYVQDAIDVRINSKVELDLVMELESAEAQVTVVAKAPEVNVNKTHVGETFDKDFVDSLPLATRDFQGVQALTPGVRDDGSGNPQMRGGTYFNNNYSVDGFTTTDPVTHTFGQNFSFDAMSQVEVQTAGFGAENSSTTGGITNIVTKSGSNRLEFDAVSTYTDNNLSFFRDARDAGRKFRASELSLNIGGPIVKDRLWFFVSAEGLNSVASLPKDTSGLFPEHPPLSILGLNSFVKLTWQLTPRNKLELKGVYSPGVFNNLLQSPLVEREAEARSYQWTRFLGLSWQSILTDSLLLVARAGIQDISLNSGPQSCVWDPDNCAHVPGQVDISTGILRGNYTSQVRDVRRTYEFSGNAEYIKTGPGLLGNHSLRFSWRFLAARNPTAVSVPGDEVLYTAGTEPFAQDRVCSNDPKLSGGECRSGWLVTSPESESLLMSVQDAWKPTRYVTVRPGVAFHRGFSETELGRNVTDMTTFTPHLGVTWDATHDGRTVLKAAYNHNVDTGFLALAGLTSRQLSVKSCEWDEDAKAYVRNCRSSGGANGYTVGSPCGPDGLNPDGTSCKTSLRAPRTFEYTLGAERELITGVVLGFDYVYRKFVHQFEDLETNFIWNKGGSAVARTGGYKNGRAESVYDLETPDAANRRYHSATTFLRKRQGLFKFFFGYTWTRSEGVDNSSYVSLFLDNPGQTPYYYGPLPDDIRHDLIMLASYQVRSWVSVGGTYKFESGAPYNRYFFDQTFRSFSRLQAQRGYDSRGNLNPDDDVQLRLPDLSELALQARFNFKPLIGQNLEAWVDLFNLLALRTTTSVIQSDGPFFGTPVGRLPPTRARFGVRYRF